MNPKQPYVYYDFQKYIEVCDIYVYTQYNEWMIYNGLLKYY